MLHFKEYWHHHMQPVSKQGCVCGGGGLTEDMGELLSGMEGVEDLLWGTECMNLSLNEGAGAGG